MEQEFEALIWRAMALAIGVASVLMTAELELLPWS